MADEADRMVERAIESVLDQVPGTVDTSLPEGTPAKLQPWAETAAPAGRNKRPLEELLEELAARVRADPHARAGAPQARHPAAAFFDRFGGGRGEAAQPGTPGGRKRRRRRSSGAREGGGGDASATATAAPPGEGQRSGRRRRRGRGRSDAAAAPPEGSRPQSAESARPAGRRRRGRRGRGGRGAGGGGGAGAPA